MKESYHRVAGLGRSILKAKGSRFLGFSFIVTSELEVKSRLEEVKKQYSDARHWCYAYRLDPEGSLYRSSDDGEPSHSAGDPILRQIDSRGLTNTLVVVVRYFGGVKLGVGGLIDAYGGCASEALDEAGIVECVVTSEVEIRFSYAQMNDIMRVLKRHRLSLKEHEFSTSCRLTTDVPIAVVDVVLTELDGIPFIEVKRH